MPSPAIYVVAIVASVAAGLAFKELIYDAHVAPKIDEWTQTYAAYRRDRRRRRASPHASSNLDLDDKTEERDAAELKSTVELENMVAREMQDFKHEGILRYRYNRHSNDLTGQVLEKPNSFIPFELLSPMVRAPSSAAPPPPNPFASSSDDTTMLPIGRLPTPVSDRPSSPPVQRIHSTGSSQLGSQLALSSRTVSPPPPSPPPHISGPPSSRAPSESDFVLADVSERASSPRPISPLSGSRATTPFTDAHSEVSSIDFMGSDVTGSSLLDSEERFGYDAADFLHGDVRSDVGSEDWERVSNARSLI